MSNHQYYHSININRSPYGYEDQPIYPPLLYAHDPSVPIKDEPENDSSYSINCYSDTPGHPSFNSFSPEQQEISTVEFPLPSEAETEMYLRNSLGIYHPMPLNLYSLPDCIYLDEKKPPIMSLIALAIWGSARRKLTLRQIHDAVAERYPSWPSEGKQPWKESIRHNLSLKGMFRHENREGSNNPKSGYWYLNTAYMDSDKRKRSRKGSKDGSRDPSDGHEHDSCDSSPLHPSERHADAAMPHGSLPGYYGQMRDAYSPQAAGATSQQGYQQLAMLNRTATSYVFVPEMVHRHAYYQGDNAIAGPSNLSYSNYPGTEQARYTSESAQGTSNSSNRRRTGPSRPMP